MEEATWEEKEDMKAKYLFLFPVTDEEAGGMNFVLSCGYSNLSYDSVALLLFSRETCPSLSFEDE